MTDSESVRMITDKKNLVTPKVVGAFLVALFLGFAIGFDKLGSFIDVPSLQIVIVGTMAAIFASNDFTYVKCLPALVNGALIPRNEDELRPFLRMCDLGSRFSIALGTVGTLIGSIAILGNLRDVDNFGPNMAVSMITLLYGVLFSELFWLPLKANVLANYYDQFSDKEEIYSQIHLAETASIEPQNKLNLILLGFGVPLILFLIGFVAVSSVFNPTPTGIPHWEKLNIQEVVLDNFEINNIEFPKESHLFIDKDSISVLGISDEIFFPKKRDNNHDNKKKHRSLKLTLEPLSKLNHKQSKLYFTIESYDRKCDTDTLYENSFSYHVTLDTINHILVEDGDYRIEFDILPKSIEKATTVPSVSSTLSPIDGE